MTRRSIFILIDALGWEKARSMDFLPDLTGARTPLRTVLGYSGACQSTLFSGKWPSQTGHWLMYYFTPRTETFAPTRLLKPFPRWVKNRGRLRRWLARWVRRFGHVHGYYDLYDIPMEAFPYLELSEKRDLYAPGGLEPETGIFDDLERNGTSSRVWNWRFAEQEGLEQLVEELEQDRRQFYLIYWNNLDALMHVHGTHAPVVDEHIRWFERAVRRVMETASRRGGDTRLFVFSDHGMIDTSGTIDLMGPVSRLGLTYGRDYVAFFDSTMARFLFFSEGARGAVRDLLSNQEGGDLLDDEALRELGVLFPDHRYGDTVLLTRPGILIVPSYMGTGPLKAMHGFHPDHPESDALLVSNVEVEGHPSAVNDLYSIMQQELRA